jgi:hypothetical protein
VIPRRASSTEISTVTKENRTVTLLRRFAHRLKSFAPLAIPGNHSGGKEQPRADRCPTGAIRAKRGQDAASPHSAAMGTTEDAAPRSFVASARARKRGLVGCVAVAMGLFLTVASVPAASAAGTESPWWHLNSGSRPTYIDPGTARNETQQLSVAATSGTFTLTFEAKADPPNKASTAPIAFNADAAAVQSALAALAPIGPGNVQVAGGPATIEPLTITFSGALGSRNLTVLSANGSSLKGPGHQAAVTRVQAGRPDGELYFTAANLGDGSLSGHNIPVQLTDILPNGLEAVAIGATRPDVNGNFLKRVQLPCQLATLTCTLGANDLGRNGASLDAVPPFDQLEVRVSVDVKPGAETGELNEVRVSGGEAYSCSEVGGGSYGDPGCTEENFPLGNPFQRSYAGPVPPASIKRSITLSSRPVPFGVDTYEHENEEEGGTPALRAGSHPFQSTTTIILNQTADLRPPGSSTEGASVETRLAEPAGSAKDLHFIWPPGLLGNPTGVAHCTDTQFFKIIGGGTADNCPAQSAVGVATVFVNEPADLPGGEVTVPFFSLIPHFGEPARFGFIVPLANAPVTIDTSVRSDGDYGITVETNNITQIASFLSASVTVWGAPGDPRHNLQRGWGCLIEDRGFSTKETPVPSCASTATVEETGRRQPPFLSLPTSCEGGLEDSVTGDTWTNELPFTELPLLFRHDMPGLEACSKVPFEPGIHSEPTSNAATSPTGLNFDINVNDEGQQNPGGLVQSQIKKAVVTLPQGFTANPSVAEGLKACSEAEYEASTLQAGSGCIEESKVGEVEIESPLVTQKVKGSLFVAKQGDNPNHNLLTLYMVAKNAEIGVMVKQALKVEPNPVTGQLTTVADEIPQLPFSKFHLFFRQGQRSPLVTPPTCGTYTVGADLYPYSNPSFALHRDSSFQITQGPEGQGCPSGGVPPFHPFLQAGTQNNAAGSYSPFYVHMTRKDSEQEITHFSIKLPPGVSGKLAGVAECPDAGVAAAKAREHEGGGQEELNSPSCPLASEVGHSLVGSGVGNVLAYAPGKMYLAGPYHGSNLSLVSITAAKVGPFDLGTVVVRFALKIDPETAEVSVDGATSDPIPHIVDGIPVHLRDIRAYVDRPDFVLNPTSCKKTSTASTVLGSGLNFASEADDVPVTVTSPFQAADCASLGFAPKVALSLKGGTKRGATPAFKAVLTFPKGAYANIAESQVTLPHSEFLEQSHIGTVCTRAQFKEGTVPGEKCPAASVYGRARAVTPILSEPLEGPVYLRSSSHQLPDLVATLHNRQVDIALDGRIDSVENGRIRNTFETVPDAPVTKFVLEMQGGKKGLLVNSTDICRTKHKAISHFVGQNGKVHDTNPVLKAKCGGKAKKKSKAKKGKRDSRAGR